MVLETRMFGLSDGEEIDASFLCFDTIPECDGQTDGQTDIPFLAIPALA